MSSGGKRKSYTLTVRGNVTVLVSETTVSTRKASVVKTDDTIAVDVLGAPVSAPPRAKYSCKRNFGSIGDGMVQMNNFTFGRGNRPVATDTFHLVPIERGRTIDSIEVFDQGRVVFSSDGLLAGVVRLSVSDNGVVVLPKGQVHRIDATVRGHGAIAGPKPGQCMWVSEAEISASDEADVCGLKVLSLVTAKTTEAASVSLIVADNAVTTISGAVQVTRVK